MFCCLSSCSAAWISRRKCCAASCMCVCEAQSYYGMKLFHTAFKIACLRTAVHSVVYGRELISLSTTWSSRPSGSRDKPDSLDKGSVGRNGLNEGTEIPFPSNITSPPHVCVYVCMCVCVCVCVHAPLRALTLHCWIPVPHWLLVLSSKVGSPPPPTVSLYCKSTGQNLQVYCRTSWRGGTACFLGVAFLWWKGVLVFLTVFAGFAFLNTRTQNCEILCETIEGDMRRRDLSPWIWGGLERTFGFRWKGYTSVKKYAKMASPVIRTILPHSNYPAAADRQEQMSDIK